MKTLLLLLMIFAFDPALAISEQNYEAAFAREVAPFFQKGTGGQLNGSRGVALNTRHFINPSAKASIVIANGYTENLQQYAELAYDFYRAGYSVFLIDHRGQGASARLAKDPELAHIDNFEFFVDDLKTYVEQTVKPHSAGLPLFIIGHSMGGGIGARYLERYPNDFRAAALMAPMIGVQLGDWNDRVAETFLESLHLLGKGQEVAYGSKKSDPQPEWDSNNGTSQSESRYRVQRRYSAIGFPPLRAATNDWVMRALSATRLIRREANRVLTPTLLVQAEHEYIVRNRDQVEFCSKAKNCRLEVAHGSRHDILKEKDEIKDPAFAEILSFFEFSRYIWTSPVKWVIR